MKKVLVIQHVPHEGLGLIGPALDSAGLGAEILKVYEKADIPRTVEGYPAIIVLGGPMGVYEADRYPFITKELKLLESALKEGVPTLGVCLGSQLLARAAGGSVYPGKGKEIGWYRISLTEEGLDDGLLSGMPDELTVFQWHGDTFDIPEGSENLASSDLFPNQLIKAGPRAYGAQFHLEVTERMIYDWIRVNGEELKSLKGVIDPAAIMKETPERMAELHRYGRMFVSRFLRLVRE